MSEQNDILAFPFQASFGDDVMQPDFGMTLRDYIAAHMAPAMLNHAKPEEVGNDPGKLAQVIARASYRFADIMLTVRKEQA